MRAYTLFRQQFDPGSPLVLTPDEQHHLQHVLRAQPGQPIRVNTPSHAFLATLNHLHDKTMDIRITESMAITQKLPHIHLIQGLPKQDKFSQVLTQCTEMGVAEITPAVMNRCVVKLDDKGKANKQKRWQQVLDSANQQSQRDIPAILNPVTTLETALRDQPNTPQLCLVPWEEAAPEQHIKQVLSTQYEPGTPITVVIGPEGGITQKEIDMLGHHGFIPVSLGPNILRTEHAGFAVLAMLAFYLS